LGCTQRFQGYPLHNAESKRRKDDQLVTLEESVSGSLVDSHSDHMSQLKHTALLKIKHLGQANGFEKESSEGLKGGLVNMIEDFEFDEQKVKHGALSRYVSVDSRIMFMVCSFFKA